MTYPVYCCNKRILQTGCIFKKEKFFTVLGARKTKIEGPNMIGLCFIETRLKASESGGECWRGTGLEEVVESKREKEGKKAQA